MHDLQFIKILIYIINLGNIMFLRKIKNGKNHPLLNMTSKIVFFLDFVEQQQCVQYMHCIVHVTF